MTVQSIDLYHIAVPLKKPIRHASHERTSSDNLVVRVTLDDGQVGYGEGIPRPYVTGETIESTFDVLASSDWSRAIGNPTSLEDVLRRLESLKLAENESDPRGMAGNSARCALEVALLDAYGHRFGQSVGQAIRKLDIPEIPWNDRPQRVRYSGAITAESSRGEWISAWKMRLNRFAHVKLKVGVPGQDDPARLARVRRILGSNVDIRLDANEAWESSTLYDRIRPLLANRPSLIEQPVPHAEVDALAELRPRLGLPVML
ncbi:enolase C-terminal domain-like protein, partial [Singulisphaera rosea]